MADRNVRVTVSARVSDFNRGMKEAQRAVKGLHDEIDKTNDRTAWLAQSILALTPAVTTLGAGAVPVISGLATQLVLTAGAAGTMALAFNGVGDSLDALNDYQLDPTAEKLEKLNEAMAKIGPEGEEFVRYLDSLGPAFSALADTARGGIFPGVTEGIESFMTLMPRFQSVIGQIAEGIGELGSDMGAGLAGPEWDAFWEYLEHEAKPLLVEMGHTLGNFFTGFANMLVAFGPLSADFSSGFEAMSQSFVDWSASLESSTGFQQFVAYVREAGPMALDFLGSAAMLFVELIEAAAPIGAIMLPQITNLVDIIATLANTPLGPLILGFTALTSAWGRLNAIGEITGSGALARMTGGLRGNLAASKMLRPSLAELGTSMAFAAHSQDTLKKSMASGSKAASESAKKALLAKTQVMGFGRAVAPVAGQVALLGAAASGLAGSFGLSNTATLALAGSLGGPWGAAAGASVGLLLDMKSAGDKATDALDGVDEALESNNYDRVRAQLAAVKAEMEDMNSIDGVGDWFSDVMGDLTTGGVGEGIDSIYTAKIEELTAELEHLDEVKRQVSGRTEYRRSLEAESAALEENINLMREKREEALRAFDAETNYAASILDAAEAFKENGATLDLNTEAGLNNRRALSGIAAAFNDLTDKQKNAKGAIGDAKKTLYDQAIQFGATKEEAKRYVRTLLEIPTKAETRIILETDTALRKINGLRAQLAAIAASKFYVTLGVRAPNLSGFGAQIGNSADGSTIPNAPGPYRDQFLYALAQKEEVISNRRGQADRFRPVLKAINLDMPPHIIKGMLADGGTAGRQYATPAWSGAGSYASTAAGIDYDLLTAAMLRARPLYGPVNINGDPTTFKRQMQRDEQAANLGGRPT